MALTGEGGGALGVMDDGDQLAMDCLQGQCMCNVVNGESIMLTSGQRCLFINGTKTKVDDLSRNSFQEWTALCGRCLIEQ
jgi:hypothetical protein